MPPMPPACDGKGAPPSGDCMGGIAPGAPIPIGGMPGIPVGGVGIFGGGPIMACDGMPGIGGTMPPIACIGKVACAVGGNPPGIAPIPGEIGAPIAAGPPPIAPGAAPIACIACGGSVA